MDNTDVNYESNETKPQFLTTPNEFIKCSQNLQDQIKEGDNHHHHHSNDSNSDEFSINSNTCPLTPPIHQMQESDDILTQDPKLIHQNQLLSSHQILYQENVERKQYSEREITYNLLLRRLVNEYLDRTITYSHQPKYILTILKSVLQRNFPEFNDSFHRERICAYLKACRRKAKKKNGEPYVRISARYLSAGTASRLADEIYMKEHDYLVNTIMNINKSQHTFNQSFMFSDDNGSNTNEAHNFTTTTTTITTINTHNHQYPQCQHPEFTPSCSSTTSYILKENNHINLTSINNNSNPYVQPILNPLNCILQQHINGFAVVKLWEQIAESLFYMADLLDAGQVIFPQNQPPNN